jgi:hypothetical protein
MELRSIEKFEEYATNEELTSCVEELERKGKDKCVDEIDDVENFAAFRDEWTRFAREPIRNM